MFKIKNLFFFFSILLIGLSACKKNDPDSTVSIEGKWQFTKEGTMTNNQEILIEYEHTVGCTKDYSEILPGNILKDHYFDNPNCQETIDTGNWSKNGNNLVFTYQNQPVVNSEILELTNTTLKVKFVRSGVSNLVVLTRIQ